MVDFVLTVKNVDIQNAPLENRSKEATYLLNSIGFNYSPSIIELSFNALTSRVINSSDSQRFLYKPFSFNLTVF